MGEGGAAGGLNVWGQALLLAALLLVVVAAWYYAAGLPAYRLLALFSLALLASALPASRVGGLKCVSGPAVVPSWAGGFAAALAGLACMSAALLAAGLVAVPGRPTILLPPVSPAALSRLLLPLAGAATLLLALSGRICSSLILAPVLGGLGYFALVGARYVFAALSLVAAALLAVEGYRLLPKAYAGLLVALVPASLIYPDLLPAGLITSARWVSCGAARWARGWHYMA